jgi:hypothetical protein
MKKKLQVHALPTEKASPLIYNNNSKGWFIGKGLKGNGVLAKYRMGNCTNYHIYFTSDEEIKDWYIYQKTVAQVTPKALKTLLNHPTISPPWKEGRKIVATTNPDLWRNTYIDQRGRTQPDLKNILIPKIPTDFIKVFVEAQGKITEVMLEYNEPYQNCKYGCDIIQATECTKQGCGYSLELNPDSTVIWSLAEERMYTRDEFKKAIRDTLWGAKGHSPMSEQDYTDFDKWFNKTYPL